MKKYKATFWRSNPQLKNGGYETTTIIEARTIKSAEKKANDICARTLYGGKRLLNIELAE